MLTAPDALARRLPVPAFAARLAGLPRHDLAAAEALSLLRRFDTKFLLPAQRLGEVLARLQADYSVLSLQGSALMAYETVYLDTPAFSLYHQHHNQRLNRLKIRRRRYLDTGARYLELKRRNNRGMTVKQRRPMPAGGYELAELLRGFAWEEGAPPPPDGLREVLGVGFSRLSLMSGKYRERVSLDLDIRAWRGDGAGCRLRDLAVLELKQEKINRASPAYAAMRDMRIRAAAFSKYCISCALLYPDSVRSNRFKMILRELAPYLAAE